MRQHDHSFTDRSLSEGERVLCARIFGHRLDCGPVRIFRKSYFPFALQRRHVVMAPNGHLYFHPDCPYYRDDFATQTDLALRGLFIHEMTHVWQHQCGEAVIFKAGLVLLTRRDPYAYLLAEDKKLRHYNLEQQADIVKDYFYAKHHPHYALERGLPDVGRYERVLSEFLAEASMAGQGPKKKTPILWGRRSR